MKRSDGAPKAPQPSSVMMSERRAYISRLMLAGLPADQVAEQAAAHLQITILQAKHAYKNVIRAWAQDSGAEVQRDRVEAIQRLRRDLAQMRAPLPRRDRKGQVIFETVLDEKGNPVLRNGQPVRRPVLSEIDWTAVARHEALLSRIEGTQRPVEVRFSPVDNLRTSAARMFEAMSDEEIQAMIDEANKYDERGRPLVVTMKASEEG